MPDPWQATLAVVAGAGLGVFHFGGLWWTVRRAGLFRRPASSMLASALVRMSVVLGGFYLVADHGWQRLLLCLLGFLAGRAAVTWRLRTPPLVESREALHAP